VDTPWWEARIVVLEHLIPNNHTKFGQDIPSGCGVLEVGINESSILIIRYKYFKELLEIILVATLRWIL
jgi:hypothetical protein